MECVGKLRVPMGKGKLFSSVDFGKMWIISYMNDGRQLLSFVIMNDGRYAVFINYEGQLMPNSASNQQ